jgi:adenine C2-methylase RlmN of 23S rRNA A2503 and tRNA A37/CheY-like chemotaxis protein
MRREVKMMKKGRILIVDEDLGTATETKEFLEQKDYEVEVAHSGLKALEYLESSKFHLMITDSNVPEISGVELIKRTTEKNRDIEIILATEFVETKTIAKAKELGVKESISKPYSLEFLYKTISRLLANRALGRKKKNFLRRIPATTEIELIHRSTWDIERYTSGSENLFCFMDKLQIVLVILHLFHLEARHGICLSVSLGCPKNCPKCLSGTQVEFVRHFTADEMLAMIKMALRESFYFDETFWLYDMPFFVAVMGSGDIAFNFRQTIQAMEKLHKLSSERFVCNISTAFSKGVKKLRAYVKDQLGKVKQPFVPNLQISLDSVREKERQLLIDSKEDPLVFIKEAEKYQELTGKTVTANFVMCQGINDTKTEMREIVKSLNPEKFKIKLSKSKLPPKSKLDSSPEEVIKKMSDFLEESGFAVEIFDEKKQMGFETGGSCGSIVHHF